MLQTIKVSKHRLRNCGYLSHLSSLKKAKLPIAGFQTSLYTWYPRTAESTIARPWPRLLPTFKAWLLSTYCSLFCFACTVLNSANHEHIYAHQLSFSTHSTSWWNYYRPSLLSILAPTDFGSIFTSFKTVLNPLKSL